MSVLWECEVEGCRYSVRQAGHSVRLYANEVFHSQWNPNRPFAGGIWDCLSLPALYAEPQRLRRVLLLGLGGGAVIRQLDTLLPERVRYTALEIDPVHVRIAADWFGLALMGDRVEVVQEDAVQWLHLHEGDAFDIIIDDLFAHTAGEPVRAQPIDRYWAPLLLGHLRPDGLLIVNGIEAKETRRAVFPLQRAGAKVAEAWSLPNYENSIGVFARSPALLDAKRWQQHLDASELTAAMRTAARTPTRRRLI